MIEDEAAVRGRGVEAVEAVPSVLCHWCGSRRRCASWLAVTRGEVPDALPGDLVSAWRSASAGEKVARRRADELAERIKDALRESGEERMDGAGGAPGVRLRGRTTVSFDVSEVVRVLAARGVGLDFGEGAELSRARLEKWVRGHAPAAWIEILGTGKERSSRWLEAEEGGR